MKHVGYLLQKQSLESGKMILRIDRLGLHRVIEKGERENEVVVHRRELLFQIGKSDWDGKTKIKKKKTPLFKSGLRCFCDAPCPTQTYMMGNFFRSDFGRKRSHVHQKDHIYLMTNFGEIDVFNDKTFGVTNAPYIHTVFRVSQVWQPKRSWGIHFDSASRYVAVRFFQVTFTQ